MSQRVLVKKEEKISIIVALLPVNFTESQFIDAFIEKYPKEWVRIQMVYKEHENRTKPNKSHPMPEPKKYLLNALKTWKIKHHKTPSN